MARADTISDRYRYSQSQASYRISAHINSASLSPYLAFFCSSKKVKKLLGTCIGTKEKLN